MGTGTAGLDEALLGEGSWAVGMTRTKYTAEHSDGGKDFSAEEEPGFAGPPPLL